MNVAIVGGGPAGLRAAEVAAAGGVSVTVFDAKPSVGRKFLVAGRGGLNLTNGEPREGFAQRYGEPNERWDSLLGEFDSEALRTWAATLGVETFVAKTGRVYPREMKSAPLLRRWVQRLRDAGVGFAMNHRWIGLRRDDQLALDFETANGRVTAKADAVVLALGGGSWPQTGSDGTWVPVLSRLGVQVAPLQPANCGWETAWPEPVLILAEGKPLKNIVARAGSAEAVGELLVTRYGLEGGAIYQLGPAFREMPKATIIIDFKPSFTIEQLVAKLGPVRRNLLPEARVRWKLSDAAFAIMRASADERLFASAADVAAAAKNCAVRLSRPRPLAEAISSAGGVLWKELNDALMIRRISGVFVSGEMIDWEAPTGGYLIQGCFATGTRAGRGALEWARSHS
ncbi:MAG: TIGR03862 family flavoprotein [Chthoniobacterales bacterium]|nr:TIGR03862 family flavoprotein [Chthoniobacterales bacterium]